MSDNIKKQYSSEFRESAVKLAIESNQPTAQSKRFGKLSITHKSKQNNGLSIR